MGINSNTVHFLRHCKEIGVDFESTLQIGRQNCYFSLDKAGVKHGDFAEPFFRFLGAKKVESIDYSDYQQASIIHDMNLPINENLRETFSAVIDGGTLEHVFNYPVAIKNCMDMVKIDGHLILITPANNFFGHGFYQFSPELFFSLLNDQNGFAETQIFEQDDSMQWFKIQNPKSIKCRVDICIAKNNPSLLCVVSKKIKSTPEKLEVLQSDYVDLWKSGNSPAHNGLQNGRVKSFIKKFIPALIRKFRGFLKARKMENIKKKLFYLPYSFLPFILAQPDKQSARSERGKKSGDAS
jgi:hypothetical protein